MELVEVLRAELSNGNIPKLFPAALTEAAMRRGSVPSLN